MSVAAGAEVDTWLRQGGLVVTGNERAARALSLEFHRARQAEGLKAWESPEIRDWNSFIRWAWNLRSRDGRLVLNRAQEQAVWADIALGDARLTALLEGPRYRLAGLAMEAHELLCSHSPHHLRTAARGGWQYDAAAFSRWLSVFDETCRAKNLVSAARLPLELLGLLETGEAERPPILLAGFDRILPVQRAVLEAWGRYQEGIHGTRAMKIEFHEAADDKAELAACARWCRGKLAAAPGGRILIVTQDVATRRGEIERAFLEAGEAAGSLPFEFSLGIPLSQAALPRATYLLLRWLSGSLEEHELDWLISTGLAVANEAERAALEGQMLRLRRRGLQQPDWTLRTFIQLFPKALNEDANLKAWAERMGEAQRKQQEMGRRGQSPLDWAEAVPQLMETMGFGRSQGLGSAAYQAGQRCRQALETAASLGFDGRRLEWKEFLSLFARTLEETLFAPESQDAPILILGPAESAGLSADAVWFLGATEAGWPARGATHPLLPLEVQREAKMPHATPQLDWELARAMSLRLIASAGEVHFSYAHQVDGTEQRASRVIAEMAGEARGLSDDLALETEREPASEWVEDAGLIPYPSVEVRGGARVLTYQSQCPFKAFATARLGAEGWERAEAGLSAAQRGQLLHEVLHAVWAGPPGGIRTQNNLLTIADRDSFISKHVRRAFETALGASVRDRMPARYLEAEQRRLARLVSEWLGFEATRIRFEVLETEAERTVAVGGLSFKVRLDRLDRLIDDSVLVVDYKSGDVTARSWELPRPDDIQLPLYSAFALSEDQLPGGLVFAKVRAGKMCFAGLVGNAEETLLQGLHPRNALVANPLGVEVLDAWRDRIEELSRDFIAGRAEVDPRDAPKTCERCGLQTLCRVQEDRTLVEDEAGDAEGTDE